jgi:hypothetical protein
MLRRCPGCGKDTARPIHETRYTVQGAVPIGSSVEWECGDCYRRFKLNTPGQQAFWGLLTAAFALFGVLVVIGRIKARPPGVIAFLLFAQAAGMAIYVWIKRRQASRSPIVEAKSPPVVDQAVD